MWPYKRKEYCGSKFPYIISMAGLTGVCQRCGADRKPVSMYRGKYICEFCRKVEIEADTIVKRGDSVLPRWDRIIKAGNKNYPHEA